MTASSPPRWSARSEICSLSRPTKGLSGCSGSTSSPFMQPPVKGFVTMGLDPGYRNGCKVAVVDGTGKVLDTAVVYPTFSERKKQEAIDVLARLIKKSTAWRTSPSAMAPPAARPSRWR